MGFIFWARKKRKLNATFSFSAGVRKAREKPLHPKCFTNSMQRPSALMHCSKRNHLTFQWTVNYSPFHSSSRFCWHINYLAAQYFKIHFKTLHTKWKSALRIRWVGHIEIAGSSGVFGVEKDFNTSIGEVLR